MLRVAVVDEGRAMAIVVAGGRVRSNRPVVVDPAPELPALTEKDRTAVDIAVAAGVDHFALGYAASAAGVEELRALLPAGARLLARIDSRSGVERRAEIIAAADTVVVGRRHLAAELPIEQVPFLQKAIAREGAAAGTPVWVTTGRSGPSAGPAATVAEANDVANLLLDGVSGLVLTGESAVGSDPVGAVERVAELLDGLRDSACGLTACRPGRTSLTGDGLELVSLEEEQEHPVGAGGAGEQEGAAAVGAPRRARGRDRR